MNNSPLVSILMNCYNGEKYLQEAINSVINQTYQNWELIFWDNQSNDESAKIFFNNKDTRLNYYLSPFHTTLGDARVMASKKIKGQWLGILDTDDIWEPDKLTKQIDLINKVSTTKESIGLVYSRTMGINNTGDITKELCHKEYINSPMPHGMILHDLLFKGNFILSPSMLINTKIFFSVGGYPDGYKHASDYFISCAISSKAKVIYVDEFLTKYRIHEHNNTHKEKVVSFEEQIKIFNFWSKNISASLLEKNLRIKQLQTFAGLMMIKYNKQIFKGLIRILKYGHLPFAVKNLFLELKKLNEN